MRERWEWFGPVAAVYSFLMAALGLSFLLGGAVRSDGPLMLVGALLGLTGASWGSGCDLRKRRGGPRSDAPSD